MKLKLSSPVVVAAGPESAVTGWGVYQFPDLIKLPDGRLMCCFADSGDTIDAYGAERGCRISSDGGKTWEKARERDFDSVSGILLDNGERVQFIELPSVKITEDMRFPEPVGGRWGKKETYYLASQLDESICNTTWLIHRVSKEHPQGVQEPVKLNWPDMVVRTGNGIVVPPQPWGRLRKDPCGHLWMPTYSVGFHPENGGFCPYLCNYLFRSVDNGHTWDLMDFLPYVPDINKDPLAFRREGFNENNICFTPDGTYIRLVRTDSRMGPFYIVRSHDRGVTWEAPELFDDRGVWPQLLSLECGVTLATYGRPGFFLRATQDPACVKWEDRIELIHTPQTTGKAPLNTCSYSDLIALDDHTAGLVYTDFSVRDEKGVPRKTVLFRTVTVEE